MQSEQDLSGCSSQLGGAQTAGFNHRHIDSQQADIRVGQVPQKCSHRQPFNVSYQ